MELSLLYGLYVILAVGAAAVYGALPRPAVRSRMIGHILGIAALVGVLFWLGRFLAGESAAELYFLVFAGLALVGAFRLITHPKPVYSALYFILVVLAVAGLLVLQEAEFLAIALAIIYAGAILVTYLFVIMLAQQDRPPDYDTRSRAPLDAVAAGFLLIAVITGQIGELPRLAGPAEKDRQSLVTFPAIRMQAEPSPAPEAAGRTSPGNTDQLGVLLLTRYMMAMQLAGVLLLVAMVGAIALACKHVPADTARAGREPPPGILGRTAEPF